MKKNLWKQVAGVAVVGLLVTACNSNEEVSLVEGFGAEESALWESVDLALDGEIDGASFGSFTGNKSELAGRGGLSDCATVTSSGDEFPKTITIDFGEGCEGRRGHVKSGVIVITLTDELINAGASRTVSFENFYVDDKAVTGSRVVTNEGQNGDGNWVMTRTIDMTMTDAEGATMTRTSSGSKTWLAGFADDAVDNVYLLSGSGTVTDPDGNTYSKTILEAIHVDQGCGYPIAGIVEMVGPERSGTIDFGDGTCDNVATLTNADGESVEIDLDELKRRKRRRLRG